MFQTQQLRKIFSINPFIASLEDKLNFEVRPGASNGLWLMFLLPATLLISAFKCYDMLSSTYKLLPLYSVGLSLTSIYIIRGLHKEQDVKLYRLWFYIPISLLFYIFLNTGFLFSLYSGFFCTIGYSKAYFCLLRLFPKSFTLGEASLVSQAFTILLYTTLPHFYYSIEEPIFKTGKSYTVIIQMELFAVMVLAIFVKYCNFRQSVWFYFYTFAILCTTFLIPVHVFLRRSPILLVLRLLIEDFSTIKMVTYWLICCCLTALAIVRQQNTGDKASSSERKIFHLLAVAVYIPGIIYKCNLLYLGSGILLGIFFLLEICRNFNLTRLGSQLQASFMALSDAKDAGVVAVTPIYLLTACTLPMWIHPAPCDIVDGSFFSILPLLSGILSVGIGDTVASVYGSRYGKLHYADSKKTIEGTVASIFSQLLTVYILYVLGYIIKMDVFLMLRITIGVVVSSVVEAKTDQIDNLILPFIMYIFLI